MAERCQVVPMDGNIEAPGHHPDDQRPPMTGRQRGLRTSSAVRVMFWAWVVVAGVAYLWQFRPLMAASLRLLVP
jgi:hypothetical protein